MIKRLTWFVGGAVAGAVGAGAAKRKVKSTAAALAPTTVARQATQRVRDAVTEGRRAARTKEAELRARLEGRHVSLADHLSTGDEVLVDGQPVDPAQVIVLRDAAAAHADRRRKRA